LENQQIIGVYDSGAGGLTVLKELVRILPTQSFIYFADTANCPYGPRGKDEIIKISTQITNFLISKGSCIIVVACNTATASAIDHLRVNYKIPFVGMEPAVKPAAISTKTKAIGVLATEGTFNGRLYKETTTKYAKNINVIYEVGNGLVELVEQGKSNSKEAKTLLEKYIRPMLNQNIDHLVLGCTHYPFFIPVLKEILPKSVSIINPAPAVAKQTQKVFFDLYGITSDNNPPFINFYSSGNTETLKQLVKEIEDQDGIKFFHKRFLEIELEIK
jgi:glutamate racemase